MKLTSLQPIEVEALRLLNSGQKIQLEYNPKTHEVKLLHIMSKKITAKNGYWSRFFFYFLPTTKKFKV